MRFSIISLALLALIQIDNADSQDGATLGFRVVANDDYGSGRKAQPGWSGHALNEYASGHPMLLAPLLLPPVGGELTIESIKVHGNKLEISIANPSTTGTHVIQQAFTVVAPQWLDVDNPDFSSGPGGAVVATFPKPTNSLAFYRVEVRRFQGE